MSEPSWVNFDLTLHRENGDPHSYVADVTSPWSRVSGRFRSPLSAAELDDLRANAGGPAADAQSGTAERDASGQYSGKVSGYGERLYEAVFTGPILTAMTLSLSEAERNEKELRIRICLDHAPELAELPWEYLFDRQGPGHLALGPMPIVRRLNVAVPRPRLLVKPPVNILVMTAAPSDLPELDGDAEWQRLQSALAATIDADLVKLKRVPQATTTGLRESLQRGDWHVFHFIGHGGCDGARNAVLWFEDELREAQAVTSDDLVKLLGGHSKLRLAVLNSCDGARSRAEDPFAGLAQGLLRARIPTVIAMQFKITDASAIQFASGFYAALANNLAIDHALTEARKAMYFGANRTEWGTPVLFMSGDDCRAFEIDLPTEQQLREREIKTHADDARLAIDAGRYGDAIGHLQAVMKLQGPTKAP